MDLGESNFKFFKWIVVCIKDEGRKKISSLHFILFFFSFEWQWDLEICERLQECSKENPRRLPGGSNKALLRLEVGFK